MPYLHEDRDPSLGPRLIQDGDEIIVYEDIYNIKSIIVRKDGAINNRYGKFSMNVRISIRRSPRMH